jgi:hypothetical protein
MTANSENATAGAKMPDSRANDESAERVVAATRRWLEKAVIGLRLCPFAAAPYRHEQIRYTVSEQRSVSGLVRELTRELEYLHAADPLLCETSLLIHPHVLTDFADYNQFLSEAEATVRALGLEGVLQIASFHPAYRFAGSAPNDVENYTNRSPYPMLHLLRETSVTRAVAAFPDASEIVARNKVTLRDLGDAGWQELWARD